MKINFLKNILKIFIIGTTLLSPAETQDIKKIPVNELEKMVIMLDPGHGKGNAAKNKLDMGTVKEGYREVDIVLKQAKKTKEILEKTGKYKVILTRENNEDTISCGRRPMYANEKGADLFASFHVNSNPEKNVKGFEIFYRYKKDTTFAKIVLNHFEKGIDSKNRGMTYGNKRVIKDLNCPGILIESGFLSNSEDRKYILDTIPNIERAVAKSIDDYSNYLDKSITDSLKKYLNKNLTNIYK